MCNAYKDLQEVQTITLMLCKVEFSLSGKVVALPLDKGTA